MQEFMNVNIKDIIEQYPKTGEILQEHNIACVSCNVGTCLLRDILEIHNLSQDEEREVLTRTYFSSISMKTLKYFT